MLDIGSPSEMTDRSLNNNSAAPHVTPNMSARFDDIWQCLVQYLEKASISGFSLLKASTCTFTINLNEDWWRRSRSRHQFTGVLLLNIVKHNLQVCVTSLCWYIICRINIRAGDRLDSTTPATHQHPASKQLWSLYFVFQTSWQTFTQLWLTMDACDWMAAE